MLGRGGCTFDTYSDNDFKDDRIGAVAEGLGEGFVWAAPRTSLFATKKQRWVSLEAHSLWKQSTSYSRTL